MHKRNRYNPKMADGMMAKGGQSAKELAANIIQEEKLIKELQKLQRELNSSRLSTYKEGDTSEEEKARQRERASKLKRFYEILEVLNESEYAHGGMMAKGGESMPLNRKMVLRIAEMMRDYYQFKKIDDSDYGFEIENYNEFSDLESGDFDNVYIRRGNDVLEIDKEAEDYITFNNKKLYNKDLFKEGDEYFFVYHDKTYSFKPRGDEGARWGLKGKVHDIGTEGMDPTLFIYMFDNKDQWENIPEGYDFSDYDEYADGGMMESQTVSEAAEQAVGSATWHRLDEMQKAGVVGELVTDGVIGVRMAEGSMVATGFVVTFILMDGKKVERKYKNKEDMDEGIANAYIEFDIENIEVAEEKPAKEKVGLFAMAKKAEPKKSKGAPKPEVVVEGIEEEIARYDQLKEIINSAKAEQELIGGRLKEIGKENFLEIYEEKGSKPDNFNLKDGDEEILFIVMDKYKKVEPEKEALLEKYDGLLEKVTTYSFNPEVLARVGNVVEKLIMNTKEISEADKEKLLIVNTTIDIKKGTIDRLMDYDNPEEIFDLIEPILALK